jgi:uncharacterized cofD-like protein
MAPRQIVRQVIFFMLANLKSASRFLRPGLGLKRWLAPLLVGLVILGLGIGLFLRWLTAAAALPPLLQLILLQSLPDWARGLVLMVLGVALTGYSLIKLNALMLGAFLPDQASVRYVARRVYRHRRRRREGPKVVAIGGGTGLSVLLSGLKDYTENITGIVTVADDGGSSGKLRRELGVLPPGDFRNCIAALADDEALTTQLFQYRFRTGGLEGHSFGNLFITAMAEVTGSFEKALYESGRVLNIRGTILPSTLEDVTLCAEVEEGPQTRKVEGESAIPEAMAPIERVYLQPDAPAAFPPALQAILGADLIVAGPGSLYTSIIPNLLVAEIASAIRSSNAPKIYICNVATQPGETEGYTIDDHVQAIQAHTDIIEFGLRDAAGEPEDKQIGHKQASYYLFDYVLANNNQRQSIPAAKNHLQTVLLADPGPERYQVIGANVVDEQYPWRHDSTKLAKELMNWYKQVEA